MSSSSLVTYTRLSPNRNSPRKYSITRITPHCVVGQFTAKQILDMSHFVTYDPENGSSCNYAIGKDGSIGLGVDEGNRSWCSSSPDNDHRAVTIEVSSDKTHPYAITDAAYNALLDLMTDICKRNGKTRLVWPGSKDAALAYKPKDNEMVMTAHRFFANKACPGDYMYSRFSQMAEEVTKRLTKEDEDDMTYYKTINDVPDDYKASIQKLITKGVLKGYGNGQIDVSEDFCRTMTVLDRLGKL